MKCECFHPDCTDCFPSKKEKDSGKIIGVAVKQGDIFICLPKPKRHHDCIYYAVDTLGLMPPIGSPADNQGFYTAEGKYLNRAEALKVAKKHNQLINKDAKHYLFSEDLW